MGNGNGMLTSIKEQERPKVTKTPLSPISPEGTLVCNVKLKTRIDPYKPDRYIKSLK